MSLPRERAYIVGEDEVLQIARRAELDARHDLVELEAELSKTRLADQHDGAAADQVGDDLARDLRHRDLLLLLASAEREPDRVEIEKHGHGVADLQHGAGKFEPGSTAPGIPRGHVEQERMIFRAAKAPVRSSCVLPGGIDAISPPPRRRPNRKMTIRCMGITSLQHVGSVGLMYSRPNRLQRPWRDP